MTSRSFRTHSRLLLAIICTLVTKTSITSPYDNDVIYGQTLDVYKIKCGGIMKMKK